MQKHFPGTVPCNHGHVLDANLHCCRFLSSSKYSLTHTHTHTHTHTRKHTHTHAHTVAQTLPPSPILLWHTLCVSASSRELLSLLWSVRHDQHTVHLGQRHTVE